MRVRLRRGVLISLILLAVCGARGSAAPAPSRRALTVFAAASLTDAFREIGAGFERRHPRTKVHFNFASSALLRTQIEQGAPADLFASADREQMTPLVKAGRLRAPVVFARNRLAIVTPAANPGRIEHPRDLGRPGLRLVITSEQVPIGRYTRAALAKMSDPGAFGPDFRKQVMRNVVSQEPNVRSLLSRVTLGEADAAIVYLSDARAGGTRVRLIPIPGRYNVAAVYPAAIVDGSAQASIGQEFLTYLRSSESRGILKKHGFD
jgi:molybdate transport system substrate-binding protein